MDEIDKKYDATYYYGMWRDSELKWAKLLAKEKDRADHLQKLVDEQAM